METKENFVYTQIRKVVPGEVIARENQGFMGGWGTFSLEGQIYSALAGLVQTVNKLVTVVPGKTNYKPEVGDVVIGKIIAIDKKSWKVDINSQRDGNLQLTAINLPLGEQRRRSEEDKLQMRKYFDEGDLVSGEVQMVQNDGCVQIQTRNMKYGKLRNGLLLRVNHALVKKMKFHFIDLVGKVKALLGKNGLVWIYCSAIKNESEYFSEDQSKINTFNKHEIIDEDTAVALVLFKNIFTLLDKLNLEINKANVILFHGTFMAIMNERLKQQSSEGKLLDLIRKNLCFSSEIEDFLLQSYQQQSVNSFFNDN